MLYRRADFVLSFCQARTIDGLKQAVNLFSEHEHRAIVTPKDLKNIKRKHVGRTFPDWQDLTVTKKSGNTRVFNKTRPAKSLKHLARNRDSLFTGRQFHYGNQ